LKAEHELTSLGEPQLQQRWVAKQIDSELEPLMGAGIALQGIDKVNTNQCQVQNEEKSHEHPLVVHRAGQGLPLLKSVSNMPMVTVVNRGHP
jgi:hypothetical protein